MKEAFHRFAARVSDLTGSPWGFTFALGIILVWAACGPFFGYSDVWQLAVNTGTTIITFLMVFLIQHAQNRDTRALHAKLDEIIHALPEARNKMAGAESMTDDELKAVLEEYRRRHPDEDD